ncbi:MAG: 50S ribosomal protein L11 methyltransferase, partial [Acidobacteriota bacterium]
MSYLSVSGHRSMALDVRRNDAYRAALEQAITPDSVVLDLGAGTGVLGLMAARLGARRVYLVEPEDVIAVAEEIVRANSLQDVVTCLQGRIEDVKPPEPVDVIVSVLTGNFLLTEDLLRTLYHA